MLRKLLCDERGIIFRGAAAIIFIVIITLAMLIDLVQGNTGSVGPWFSIIVFSAILTGIGYLLNRKKSPNQEVVQDVFSPSTAVEAPKATKPSSNRAHLMTYAININMENVATANRHIEVHNVLSAKVTELTPGLSSHEYIRLWAHYQCKIMFNLGYPQNASANLLYTALHKLLTEKFNANTDCFAKTGFREVASYSSQLVNPTIRLTGDFYAIDFKNRTIITDFPYNITEQQVIFSNIALLQYVLNKCSSNQDDLDLAWKMLFYLVVVYDSEKSQDMRYMTFLFPEIVYTQALETPVVEILNKLGLDNNQEAQALVKIEELSDLILKYSIASAQSYEESYQKQKGSSLDIETFNKVLIQTAFFFLNYTTNLIIINEETLRGLKHRVLAMVINMLYRDIGEAELNSVIKEYVKLSIDTEKVYKPCKQLSSRIERYLDIVYDMPNNDVRDNDTFKNDIKMQVLVAVDLFNEGIKPCLNI